MTRRIGILLVVVALGALFGWQAIQAGSAEKQALVSVGSTSNMKVPQPTAQKLTEDEAQALLEANRLKAEMERQELMMASEGTEEVAEVDWAALEDANKAEFERAALDALARMEAGIQLTPAQKELVLQYLEQNPGYSGRNESQNPLDNVGGPDGASYYYVDNVAPDTATYDWIELRGDVDVTWVNAWSGTHDDSYSSSKYAVGFPFSFYGVNYDSVRLSTNGFIQFTTTSSSLSNVCLPSTNVAGPGIFPYWDDLHLDYGGIAGGTDVIGIKNFGSYTVIEFDSIGHCCANENASLKFEAILFSDGRIKFQYNNLVVAAAYDSTQTIGIQSNGAAGSAALTYVCNTTGIQPVNGLAIWFYQYFYDHNFATTSIASPSGYYLPNTNVSVTARFTNAGLTTEDSPVKYSFNGGPVETEATGVLAQNAFEDHTFTTQITTPATPGAYTMTVWSDLATDQARGNDTLRTTVQVGGDDCANAITLTGLGPDSTLFNNCAMTDNTPGQPCGASGKDIVFLIDVPDGYQAVLWQTSNTIDSRHTLRWGGTCPGDNFIDCQDSPDEKKMRFVNQTGSTQTAYLVVGGYSTSTPCGNMKVAWEVTSCAPVAPPVVEGFEGPALPLLPACWSTVQALPLTLTTSPLWENYGTNPRTGTRVASVLGATTGNDDWLFSSGVSLTGGTTYVVEFYWRGASTTVPESLEVKAGTENTVAGMTETVMPMDTIKRTVYTQRITNFVAPLTDTYYFGWHNVTKRSAGRTYIDDAQIYESGSCEAPTVTVNSVTGQDSATLVATVVGGLGGPPEFQWFTSEGCVPGNEIAGATEDTYTTYTSGVYSCKAWIVDPDNCASCDSATATVIDCSIPVSLPFFEGFEGTTGTALPVCWAAVTYDSDTRNWVTSTTNPRTGLRCAYIQYSAAGVLPNDWLFTPPFTLTAGTDYLLDFWWRQYLTSSTYYDSLQVLLTTAPNNGSVVATVVPAFRANVTTYQNSVTNFSPPATGDYYLAFVYTGSANAGGIRVDDVSLYPAGGCSAPTVSVADSSRVGSVIMFCNAQGGFGGPIEYQWYTGQTCTPGNEIAGANSSTYTTTVSGDYACQAWRFDPVNCAGCDWGHAEVLPPPPGEMCSNAIVATPPNANDSTVVSGTTVGFVADNPDTCDFISSGADVFYSLTLTSCRRITMKLEDSAGGTADMHIAVYESDRCGGLAILCDDDKGNFDPIWWENPAQRPSASLASFVGGELPAGTYYIRVSRFSTGSGPYRLAIFDNGPCACDLTCEGGDQIETAEDRYLPNFPTTDPDGGCNSSPNVFGTIAVDQTVCGVGFNYLSHSDATHYDYFRDTDWYQFSVPAADTIHWAVTSEFRATIGLLSTTCPSPGFVVADTASAGTSKTVSAYLTPGDYLAFVAPNRFVGNPLPSTYRAILTGTGGCVPDTVTDLTVYRALGLSTDVILRWTADLSFPGTYKVYRNTFPDAFPGSWVVLASGITPAEAQYVDTGTVGANPKRFYLVVGVCP